MFLQKHIYNNTSNSKRHLVFSVCALENYDGPLVCYTINDVVLMRKCLRNSQTNMLKSLYRASAETGICTAQVGM